MNNSLEKRALVGDLSIDMGAGAKRARTGGLYHGSTKHSEAFLSGYRAFVFGGREVKFSKLGKVVHVAGGIEPFDHLTEAQKQEWRAGIEYARQERDECRALPDSHKPIRKGSFYAEAAKRLQVLRHRKNFSIKAAAAELDVSETWVCERLKEAKK